jgi:hypothetical protein
VCAEGYAGSIGYKCSTCDGTLAGGYVLTGIAALLCISVVVHVLRDMLDIRGSSSSRSAGSMATGSGIKRRSSSSCVGKLRGVMWALMWSKLRTPYIVLQIITQFVAVTGLQLPALYKQFLRLTAVLNLDIGWMLSFGCLLEVNFYGKLLLVTLTPILVTVFLLCSYAAAYYWHNLQAVTVLNISSTLQQERPARLQRIKSKHMSGFLIMTFLLYSTVSTAVFQTFACDTIVSSGQQQQATWLRADYSVSCSTRKHAMYQAYAAVMLLLYPIGIPCCYGYVLWRNRRLLDPATTPVSERCSMQALAPTEFLWSAYRPAVYWWEGVECVRRLLLTGVVVFIYPNTAAQASVACLISVLSLAAAMQCHPYAGAADSLNYVTGCAVVFLTIFLSLLVKFDSSVAERGSANILSGVLILMNVAIICIAVVQMVAACRATAFSSESKSRALFQADSAAINISMSRVIEH